jgi:predicted nucleotidyltransferase
MPSVIPERVQTLFKKFPALFGTIEKLNEANIPFLIGGSGCLFLLGNERSPDDVDIYLPDDSHDKADQIFETQSFTYKSPSEDVRNSNPNGDHSMQLTSRLRLNILDKTYDLSLNTHMFNQALPAQFDGLHFQLLPPEDVLLIKALLQRGKDVGKHDIEDIKNFLSIISDIRRDYLNERIHSLDATERVGTIFSV